MMAAVTIHAPVSKFVMNGADLMLPGLLIPSSVLPRRADVWYPFLRS
jgi:predicted ribosome-associated RNA-binding protein Tma20